MPRAPVLVAILAAIPALASPPALNDLYRAGELGIVDVNTTDGRLVAKYKGAGSCRFKPDMQVLSGNFEGDVFLGTVFICQEGPSCDPEKTFPFFAVFHEGALAGDVKLDSGCSSPGLEGRRLNVSVASAEDRLLIRQDGEASSIAGRNSAANKKELEKAAREASLAGQLKMKEENWAQARTAFERSITYDDADWKTWSYLSTVELKLNNVAKGLECIQKAISAATKANPKPTQAENGELFYNHACALARNGRKADALKSLKNAFRVGDTAMLAASAPIDPDLEALRDEPEFKRLLAEAKSKKDKRGSR